MKKTAIRRAHCANYCKLIVHVQYHEPDFLKPQLFKPLNNFPPTKKKKRKSCWKYLLIYLFYLFIYLVTHKTLYNMNKSCYLNYKINVTRKPNEA